MDETRTMGGKWTVNGIVFSFQGLKKFAKFQSNPVIFLLENFYANQKENLLTSVILFCVLISMNKKKANTS